MIEMPAHFIYTYIFIYLFKLFLKEGSQQENQKRILKEKYLFNYYFILDFPYLP